MNIINKVVLASYHTRLLMTATGSRLEMFLFFNKHIRDNWQWVLVESKGDFYVD
jgi:hypothetical protein